MAENGRHQINRFDPTETPESDPVPTGEDVVNRQKSGHDTPRRYDEVEEKETRENPQNK